MTRNTAEGAFHAAKTAKAVVTAMYEVAGTSALYVDCPIERAHRDIYAAGINQALAPDREFLVGDTVTIADICFVAELSLFCNEKMRARELEKKGLGPILHAKVEAEFPRAFTHFARLRTHPAFAPDMEPYLKKIEATVQAEAE